MSTKVNPPPETRIPAEFFKDPEKRAFFEAWRTILFQLWIRTGGSFDAVAGKQIVIITGSDIVLDNSAYGALIVVEADSAAVQVTLPAITQDTAGESVDVAIIDATYDTTVVPAGTETIFGDTSVLMDIQHMSIQYTAVSINTWIAT